VAELHRRARFNSFMSDGYSALDEGQFDLARQAFRQAAALNPGSAETATALEDVEAAQAARRLAGLRDQGRGNEQRERWSEAVKLYEEALRLDANVVFAREGLQRSQPRAELDAKLREIIAQPERLSDTRIARDAQALLQQAEQVSTAGPVLRKQVDELRTLLEKANTQITVTLYSDSETEVVVQKVARLGRFEQRQLSLRPGTYVAVGSRAGYRDIRQKFTVSHEAGASPVTVICQEPI
jgi:tetratricopeptide (TPR) repeat protein